ncbi:DUF4192 domain-containing protein [Streptomyces sp. AV19]|uniref:DUF4192 domain-containing protein n=1 Tax=Streptomyces sp. AV19 TaxID=2793068 RepID=UPI0018FED936|nr:DUF4192 domain-containing protein [Streptomyces sp. AV19]MBH1938645.1 DUF4192 domain-containing protein [Streptomyces sp. AV19]MDG4535357.1 DUF4192 domain-containing protein [Streptomyces sp. AV19]
MAHHNESAGPSPLPSSDWGPPAETHVTLRTPAELADALPYLLGFHPDDSIVMMALHGERKRFGGRLRLGIPADPREWPFVSEQLARTLVAASTKRGTAPDGIVLYLCQDPAEGETGQAVMERLRPLAHRLRIACGGLDVPVFEALCLSDGRFWSYCCSDARCCPPDGTPLKMPGTSVMAAAAAYAGMRVGGSLREMEARLAPLGGQPAEEQRRALDAAAAELVPRMLGAEAETVRQETLDLAELVLRRFDGTPPTGARAEADTRDDGLVSADEAAAIVLGLQDRVARDRAAEWMEGPLLPATLRLWRALARRCVPPYTEHAAAPLTLAGWVAWAGGESAEAKITLGRALTADPDYLFAQLLHHACNEGLDPESLRDCLRRERADRAVLDAARAAAEGRARPGAEPGTGGGPGRPAAPRLRRRKPQGDTVRPAPARGTAAAGGPEGKPRARRQQGRRAARDRR